MNKEKETQEALLQTVDIMIKNKLKKLNFNYYVDGVITSKNDNGTYDVLINDITYSNIPAQNHLIYQVDDVVQILIKNGNWHKKFIDDKKNHDRSLIDLIYPIGSVYITSTNTNPADNLGGVWESYGTTNESYNKFYWKRTA